MHLICDGQIYLIDTNENALSSYECSVPWEIQQDPNAFDPATDLDPVLIAGAVGAGFFVLVPLWAAIIGGQSILRAIR